MSTNSTSVIKASWTAEQHNTLIADNFGVHWSDVSEGDTMRASQINALADGIKRLEKLYQPDKVAIQCSHCGQFGALYAACKHCGAPITK